MLCIQRKSASLYVLLVFLIFAGPSLAQMPPGDTTISLRFEAISHEQGIPENRIFEILEDHLGLLWLGTSRGLIKYDGYDFQSYRYVHQDSSLASQQMDGINVYILVEGAYGDLWIGSEPERTSKPALVRFDRETETFVPYLFAPTDSLPPIRGRVSSIVADSQFIWVSALQTETLIRIKSERAYKNADEARNAPFEVLGETHGLLPDETIKHMLKDQQGRLWLTGMHGVYLWEKERDRLRYIESKVMKNAPRKSCQGISMVEGPDGSLWVITHHCGGALRFDPQTERFEFHDMTISPELLPDKEGRLWLGRFEALGGLAWYNSTSKRQANIRVQPQGMDFFPVLRVREFLQDSYGMVWIGSMEGPLLKYNPQRAAFRWLRAEPSNPNSLSHDWVTDIDQGPDGNYWFSTFGGGLNKWNPHANTFAHFNTSSNSVIDTEFDFILDISIDQQGKVWYGFPPSVASYDPKSKTVRRYPRRGGTINSITTDSKGQVWIGRNSELSRYHAAADTFQYFEFPQPIYPDELMAVNRIFEDSHGNLWLGLLNEKTGFCRFDPSTGEYHLFEGAGALSFCEDENGYIWAGTRDGLFRIEPNSKATKRYDVANGLPHAKVQSILEDNHARLWLGTENGLSCFDPEEETFRNYYESDGLPSSNFSKPCYKNEKGELFFGGTFGIVYFHPDSIQDNLIPPKLVLTQLDVFGEPLSIGGDSPLKKHISVTKSITFQHWQNDLAIHYAALHFKNPEKNQYQIKLDHYDKEWRDVGTQRIASYTNLDPGRYTFRVKAANSDGIWNEKGIALDITIRAPWYWNALSKFIYLVLVAGLVLGVYQFQLNRRLALAEADRLKKLDAFKSRFFTNITHEFRTPLTVIKGMTKQLERYERESFKNIVLRNANQLLTLINQLLDLSKLNSGSMPVHVIQGDIVLYLKYLTESYHSYASSKNISLNFSANPQSLFMDFDKEKIQQIVSNLLANAIKFTPEGGEVGVKVTSEGVKREEKNSIHPSPFTPHPSLILQIKDTGPGIPEEKLPYIFDRFYQADDSDTRGGEGTGIGLALVKELVGLLGGEIKVDSRWQEGSTFTVRLPIQNKAPLQEEVLPESVEAPATAWASEVTELPQPTGNRPLVLVVEDNPDIIQYLRQLLLPNYQLQVAHDGKEGIEKALETVPDIIISDVMMPRKDGYELCRTLKQDERTSHIPIVLLTAKGDQASRVAGLEYGADAFLSKPFDEQELFVRLEKLLELRKVLQAKYQQVELGTLGEQKNYTDPELTFLQRLEQTILEHLSEEKFRVDPDLCRAMQMSRPQLYRKIKALKDISPSEYVRQLRLRKARQLLQTTNLTIAEIAVQVGFSHPSYFTKVYSAEFGELPSETRKT